MTLPLIKIDDVANELARRSLAYFTRRVKTDYKMTQFHHNYLTILDAFAKKKIYKLIISMPPQHGKSEGSTRLLPAYILGLDNKSKLAICSYSSSLAMSFNRDIQRYIDTDEYSGVFPNTQINSTRVVTVDSWLRNSGEFEIIGTGGSLKAVGRGGGLTGHKIDVAILDDLYKDYEEANSPVVRESAWQWYVNVVKTRLHNDSQELIVFTRWNEDDIIGRLLKTEKYLMLTSFDQLDNIDKDTWVVINYPAIKEDAPTEIDTRCVGASLWPERHDDENLQGKRRLDPVRFQCLYQGNPINKEGLLYDDFKTYSAVPDEYVKRANYTDTADQGQDYLCSICYSVDRDDNIFVTDVIYTQDPMEVTELSVSAMINRNDTRIAKVESNSGGRSFARVIEKAVKQCNVTWFTQTKNKEARIKTNSATVTKRIFMPMDWMSRWPVFAAHVINYKAMFAANKHDDAADVLTGIVETECVNSKMPIIW